MKECAHWGGTFKIEMYGWLTIFFTLCVIGEAGKTNTELVKRMTISFKNARLSGEETLSPLVLDCHKHHVAKNDDKVKAFCCCLLQESVCLLKRVLA